MRNRKKVILFMGAAMMISAVSVAALSEVSVLFQAVSSKVDVHLEEFMREDGEEVPWEDGQIILPGGVLSKIPRICNDGEPCYVRTTVDFEDGEDAGDPLTSEHLVGLEKDWVCAGDYYYYKNVLKNGETVDFFQGIRIPAEWESGVNDGKNWKAGVKVDAVQAEFFTPDFEDPDPWGMEKQGYEIQKAVEEVPEDEASENNQMREPVRFEIEQQMKGFSVNAQEFFEKLSPFVPGKSQTGILEFSNQTKQAREVYMRSEILEENEFLKELELTVQIRDKDQVQVIYQGKLTAEELQEYQSIGKISAKESETVEFLIRMPEEADNRYSVKKGSVKFWFTTDLPEDREMTKPVKTGDRSYRWIIGCLGIAAICLGICICRFSKLYKNSRRKGKREW